MVKVLVGADPELFMKDPNSGQFVSAETHEGPRIKGTKWEPFKVPFGAVQIDGTALEFNIDPANTVDEFLKNITEVRKTIESYVPGYNVVAEPVAMFKRDYFLEQVPSHSRELGCNPDFNAWTMETNPRPNPGRKTFRTAAGHVHIGWTEGKDIFDPDHYTTCARVARQMDYYLGIHSLVWDKDPVRRLLYGRAGAFRPKPYGVEYRVLSNRWLASDDLIKWVYNHTVTGVQMGLSEGLWADDLWGDNARKIIDNNIVDWKDKFDFEVPGVEEVPVAA